MTALLLGKPKAIGHVCSSSCWFCMRGVADRGILAALTKQELISVSWWFIGGEGQQPPFPGFSCSWPLRGLIRNKNFWLGYLPLLGLMRTGGVLKVCFVHCSYSVSLGLREKAPVPRTVATGNYNTNIYRVLRTKLFPDANSFSPLYSSGTVIDPFLLQEIEAQRK